jgi:hypothetical protein
LLLLLLLLRQSVGSLRQRGHSHRQGSRRVGRACLLLWLLLRGRTLRERPLTSLLLWRSMADVQRLRLGLLLRQNSLCVHLRRHLLLLRRQVGGLRGVELMRRIHAWLLTHQHLLLDGHLLLLLLQELL